MRNNDDRFLLNRIWGRIGLAVLLTLSSNAFAIWPFGGVHRFDSISGTAMDMETRKPLEGVVVVVHWGLRRHIGFSGEVYSGPLAIVETVTDKNGKFKTQPVTASDIGKKGSYDSEYFPEIAFFKSGYDLTVYRHSGKEPISRVPEAPPHLLNEDEYLMPAQPSDPKQLEQHWSQTFGRPFTAMNTFSFCGDYSALFPILFSALRTEERRLAAINETLPGLFANKSGLRSMELCMTSLKEKRGKE